MKIAIIAFLAIVIILCIAALVVRFIRHDNSPLIAEGWEDPKTGFHYGKHP